MPACVCPTCGVVETREGAGPGGDLRCPACGGPCQPRRPGHRLPLSPAIVELSKSHRAAGMAPPQRIVFALLVRTLQGYRSDRFMVVFGFVMMPFFAVAGFLGGLFAMTAAHVLLASLGRWADIDLEYALYAIPLFILLLRTGTSRWSTSGRSSSASMAGGSMDWNWGGSTRSSRLPSRAPWDSSSASASAPDRPAPIHPRSRRIADRRRFGGVHPPDAQ